MGRPGMVSRTCADEASRCSQEEGVQGHGARGPGGPARQGGHEDREFRLFSILPPKSPNNQTTQPTGQSTAFRGSLPFRRGAYLSSEHWRTPYTALYAYSGKNGFKHTDSWQIQFTATDLYDKDKVDIEHIVMEEVLQLLQCDEGGLTEAEAQNRIGIFGPNKLEEKKEK